MPMLFPLSSLHLLLENLHHSWAAGAGEKTVKMGENRRPRLPGLLFPFPENPTSGTGFRSRAGAAAGSSTPKARWAPLATGDLLSGCPSPLPSPSLFFGCPSHLLAEHLGTCPRIPLTLVFLFPFSLLPFPFLSSISTTRRKRKGAELTRLLGG